MINVIYSYIHSNTLKNIDNNIANFKIKFIFI